MLRRADRAGLLQAAEAEVDADGRIPAVLAWRLARVQHQAGRLDEALASIERAREHDAEPADRAQVLASQASTHWARGELDQARAAADEALATAESSGDEGAIAAALVAQASSAPRRATATETVGSTTWRWHAPSAAATCSPDCGS